MRRLYIDISLSSYKESDLVITWVLKVNKRIEKSSTIYCEHDKKLFWIESLCQVHFANAVVDDEKGNLSHYDSRGNRTYSTRYCLPKQLTNNEKTLLFRGQ